ncbi:diguanylate cyclase [Crocosphaera sp. UHCC 0190]|uniref:diguanylate cyclase n=1 Tax=Crocosphaera sp. UHCC 0190 TaxID=3110246 RepID=UPI002B1EA772|nr:diguanylate cyclase [Crocosphaera sp. UHCC 0190]MEA5509083.1 diguanylate cyclase [Crocosphaera sp. UHCC 0190]
MCPFSFDPSRQVKENISPEQDHEVHQVNSAAEQLPMVFYQITWQFPQEIRVNFISFHAAIILGISSQEIIANPQKLIRGIYPEDYQQLKQKLTSFSDSPGTDNFQFRFLTPTHSLKYLSTQFYPSVINEESIVFEGTLKESNSLDKLTITKEKNIQNIQTNILDSLPNFIYIYDLTQQTYVYVNQGLTRVLGKSNNVQYSSCQWEQLIHPDDRHRLRSCYQQCCRLSPQDLITLQYRIQDNQGQWKWLNNTLKVFICRDDNVPIQILGTAYDVTPYKQMKSILRKQKGGEKLINAISRRIHKSVKLDKILTVSMAEMRKFLQVDRVFIYRFKPDWSGIVAFESVAEPWRSLLGSILVDQEFIEHYLLTYQQGRIQATDNIYEDGLSQCHIEWLAQLQVQANLVIPILQGEELWGLLVAQNCRSPRFWQEWEIECLKQLSIHIGIALEQEQLYRQLQLSHQELQKLVFIDGLTGVANRRHFDERFQQEWKRMARIQQPLCLIFCDVDFFKQYNDSYGHPAGDNCLQQIAQLMQQSLKRSSDLVARYGGEEFAIILPNTDIIGGVHIAGEIRSRLRSLKLEHRGSLIGQQVTLSFGIACCSPISGTTNHTLLKQADQALYQAKQEGRDRMVIASS